MRPDRQPAALVLARNALLAAHLASQRLALAEFGEFGFPANLDWLFEVWILSFIVSCS